MGLGGEIFLHLNFILYAVILIVLFNPKPIWYCTILLQLDFKIFNSQISLFIQRVLYKKTMRKSRSNIIDRGDSLHIHLKG